MLNLFKVNVTYLDLIAYEDHFGRGLLMSLKVNVAKNTFDIQPDDTPRQHNITYFIDNFPQYSNKRTIQFVQYI